MFGILLFFAVLGAAIKRLAIPGLIGLVIVLALVAVCGGHVLTALWIYLCAFAVVSVVGAFAGISRPW